MDKNLPTNAGDEGSIPCPARCHLQLKTLLSLSSRTQELQLLSSTTREVTTTRSLTTMTSSPHSLRLEKAPAQQRRPSASKKKRILKKRKKISLSCTDPYLWSFNKLQYSELNLNRCKLPLKKKNSDAVFHLPNKRCMFSAHFSDKSLS